jgi:hypothetical protein
MRMVKFDRFLRDQLTSGRGSKRTHVAVMGVGLALIAGLSAPAAAALTAAAAHDSTAPTQSAAAVMSIGDVKPSKDTSAKHHAPKKAQASHAPSGKRLHPHGITGGQQSFSLNNEQIRNAKAIVRAGEKMHLPPRAWVVAVATSLQESTLHNYGNLGSSNDHDSLGLFQQRPTSGWGSPAQLTNPEYAATAFYRGLVQVNGWWGMPLTDAAQAVQVSAFPDHYAKWEKMAGDLVRGYFHEGPYAKRF